MPEKQEVEVVVKTPDDRVAALLRAREGLLKTTGRIARLEAGPAVAPGPGFGVEVVRGLDVHVRAGRADAEMAPGDAVGSAAQHDALSRKLEKARAGLAQIDAKLANPDFTGRAPAAVIDRERARRAEIAKEVESLEAHLLSLRG
jgi:valyl-tRNA synthetase